MKSATHHSKKTTTKKNNNIHMNLDLSYHKKLVGSKTGYAGNKICPPAPISRKPVPLVFL